MILIDTSAWLEFLRDTGSAVCERVQQSLARDVAVADPVRTEVLAGDADFEVLARHTALDIE